MGGFALVIEAGIFSAVFGYKVIFKRKRVLCGRIILPAEFLWLKYLIALAPNYSQVVSSLMLCLVAPKVMYKGNPFAHKRLFLLCVWSAVFHICCTIRWAVRVRRDSDPLEALAEMYDAAN